MKMNINQEFAPLAGGIPESCECCTNSCYKCKISRVKQSYFTYNFETDMLIEENTILTSVVPIIRITIGNSRLLGNFVKIGICKF